MRIAFQHPDEKAVEPLQQGRLVFQDAEYCEEVIDVEDVFTQSFGENGAIQTTKSESHGI